MSEKKVAYEIVRGTHLQVSVEEMVHGADGSDRMSYKWHHELPLSLVDGLSSADLASRLTAVGGLPIGHAQAREVATEIKLARQIAKQRASGAREE